MNITNFKLVQNVSDMNYIVEVTIKRFWGTEVKELWSFNRYQSSGKTNEYNSNKTSLTTGG